MVNCWFGLVVWDSRATLSNNPFHKGILGIQTTDPNHQLTIEGKENQQKHHAFCNFAFSSASSFDKMHGKLRKNQGHQKNTQTL